MHILPHHFFAAYCFCYFPARKKRHGDAKLFPPANLTIKHRTLPRRFFALRVAHFYITTKTNLRYKRALALHCRVRRIVDAKIYGRHF